MPPDLDHQPLFLNRLNGTPHALLHRATCIAVDGAMKTTIWNLRAAMIGELLGSVGKVLNAEHVSACKLHVNVAVVYKGSSSNSRARTSRTH